MRTHSSRGLGGESFLGSVCFSSFSFISGFWLSFSSLLFSESLLLSPRENTAFLPLPVANSTGSVCIPVETGEGDSMTLTSSVAGSIDKKSKRIVIKRIDPVNKTAAVEQNAGQQFKIPGCLQDYPQLPLNTKQHHRNQLY